jgi:hypothetical protein
MASRSNTATTPRRCLDDGAQVDGSATWPSLLSSLQLPATSHHGPAPHGLPPGQLAGQRYKAVLHGYTTRTMDIFEGTEQIQQLVIARAISGIRIE